jgi:hypothetical protein
MTARPDHLAYASFAPVLLPQLPSIPRFLGTPLGCTGLTGLMLESFWFVASLISVPRVTKRHQLDLFRHIHPPPLDAPGGSHPCI